jgi:hypothetical protein
LHARARTHTHTHTHTHARAHTHTHTHTHLAWPRKHTQAQVRCFLSYSMKKLSRRVLQCVAAFGAVRYWHRAHCLPSCSAHRGAENAIAIAILERRTAAQNLAVLCAAAGFTVTRRDLLRRTNLADDVMKGPASARSLHRSIGCNHCCHTALFAGGIGGSSDVCVLPAFCSKSKRAFCNGE